jgi:hypothetical protein
MPQRLTRPEQLARAEATAKAKIDEEKRKLAAVQSAQRAEAKKALNQRRFHVGTLADQAGLLALDDALLTEMFALLGAPGVIGRKFTVSFNRFIISRLQNNFVDTETPISIRGLN